MHAVILSVDEVDELIAVLASSEPIAHETRERWRQRLHDVRDKGIFWFPVESS